MLWMLSNPDVEYPPPQDPVLRVLIFPVATSVLNMARLKIWYAVSG
jgi:hypothetical protein